MSVKPDRTADARFHARWTCASVAEIAESDNAADNELLILATSRDAIGSTGLELLRYRMEQSASESDRQKSSVSNSAASTSGTTNDLQDARNISSIVRELTGAHADPFGYCWLAPNGAHAVVRIGQSAFFLTGLQDIDTPGAFLAFKLLVEGTTNAQFSTSGSLLLFDGFRRKEKESAVSQTNESWNAYEECTASTTQQRETKNSTTTQASDAAVYEAAAILMEMASGSTSRKNIHNYLEKISVHML